MFDSHWRPPAGEGRGRERGRGRRDEKRGREGEMRRDEKGGREGEMRRGERDETERWRGLQSERNDLHVR